MHFFGDYIRHKRLDLDAAFGGYSLEAVAAQANMTPAALSLLEEGGEIALSDEEMHAFAGVLKTPLELLLVLAGRRSPDVVQRIAENPASFLEWLAGPPKSPAPDNWDNGDDGSPPPAPVLQDCAPGLPLEHADPYQKLFTDNPTMQLLIDPDTGVIVEANKAACSFYGYSADEMKRMRIFEINILTEEELAAEIRKARAEKINLFHFRHKLRNGTLRDVDVRSTPVGHHGKIYMHSLLFDVTERNKAEQALKESEERHRLLIEKAPIGICSVTKEGEYLSVNSAHARLYGYNSPEEMLQAARSVSHFFVDPNDRQKLLALINALGYVNDFECKIKRKDGTEIWTSRTVRAVYDKNGEFEHYEAFVSDTQARKEAELASEAARRQLLGILEQIEAGVYVMELEEMRIVYANNYLQKAVDKSLTGSIARDVLLADPASWPFALDEIRFSEIGHTKSQELRFTNERWYLCTAKIHHWVTGGKVILVVAVDITSAKEAEELKEDIERIARHDLKAPLNGIINFPGILISSGSFSETEVEMLSFIEESGRRMLNLIDSSLSLYQMETGTYKITRSPLDFVSTLKQIEGELSFLLKQKGVTLAKQLQERSFSSTEFICLQGDTTLIPFLLSNLIKNAVEASPKHETVTVTVFPDEPFTIKIHNWGEVPAAIRDNFFGKYVTHGKYKGTGLGTYSAKLIVQAHEGEIFFDSSASQGTTITVVLPQTVVSQEYADNEHPVCSTPTNF